MALPKIVVNALNLQQGPFGSVEKFLLYIGEAATNQDQLLFLNTDSDLDVELGEADSELKRQLIAARQNAGENWACVALPIADGSLWDPAVDMAMNENVQVEGVVICTPIEAAADLTAMQTKAINILAEYNRRLFFQGAIRGIDSENESWSEYFSYVGPLTNSINAARVSPVPYIFDDAVGIIAGRLCKASVSVADTPMRVETGPLVGQDQTTLPVDKNGVRYNMAHAKALNDMRCSVPVFFPDYPGLFWSDGQTLDAPAGDYQVIENLRVVDKAARAVRLVLIGLVGNRRFNSTPSGEAWAISKLMRPLREMSKSTVFQGIPFPAELKPPVDGDIVITWITRERVQVFMKARPFEIPKAIEANIVLDLSAPIN